MLLLVLLVLLALRRYRLLHVCYGRVFLSVPFQVGCLAQLVRCGFTWSEAKAMVSRHDRRGAIKRFPDRAALDALREWGASPPNFPRPGSLLVHCGARPEGPRYPPQDAAPLQSPRGDGRASDTWHCLLAGPL